jgi:hypothetical protein
LFLFPDYGRLRWGELILSTIFLADGTAITTIGMPNAKASKNERGHILNKFVPKHPGIPLHNPKYTL